MHLGQPRVGPTRDMTTLSCGGAAGSGVIVIVVIVAPQYLPMVPNPYGNDIRLGRAFRAGRLPFHCIGRFDCSAGKTGFQAKGVPLAVLKCTWVLKIWLALAGLPVTTQRYGLRQGIC